MSLLEVRGLGKSYGALRALDAADLDVAAGEFHGLIGPNGSGKSTLLKCIAGAEMPTEGSIRLGTADVTRLPPPERARAGLSLKFQITSVLPQLCVYDNVLLALQAGDSLFDLLLSRSRRRLDEQVKALLSRFRLDGRAQDLAGHLSHGEQQWLEIAMALACRPTLLLLDEPTAGMSPQERRATGELLEPLRGECALLIVEHDLGFIGEICDSLTVLDQGQVVATGPLAEVQASERVAQAYLNHG